MELIFHGRDDLDKESRLPKYLHWGFDRPVLEAANPTINVMIELSVSQCFRIEKILADNPNLKYWDIETEYDRLKSSFIRWLNKK